MNVNTLIAQIDLGKLALPEFQRGYVWSRNQVRGLMTSLYRKHPAGGLLVWETSVDSSAIKGDAPLPAGGYVDLLLDGQQRITSLYGIIKGKPPQFFDGNAQAFTGLHFNMADETFEFFAPIMMGNNPLWVDVTKVMQSADFTSLLEPAVGRIEELGLSPLLCMNRLLNVKNIGNTEFHIDQVAGEDKDIDVVVDIFNRVNSGGTTLSKGDLALARICASWPGAREEMKRCLTKWRSAGYGDLRLDWFLRCVTGVTTGEAFFASLGKLDTAAFQQGVKDAEKLIDKLLYTIAGRLGLDHGAVLKSIYAFPLLCRLLHLRKDLLSSPHETDKVLYWYVNTLMWGRYSGSTETVLNQDLRLLDVAGKELDRLIDQLRQTRGDLDVRAENFRSFGRGSRFYPLLYMLTRTLHARDLESGLDVQQFILGKGMQLQLHHIFPKAKLYKYGYERSAVNDLANFMFLPQETNLKITDHDPSEYFAAYETKHPGILSSHWIPLDQSLWTYERYPDFLQARRELLARATNDFLTSLYRGEAEREPQFQQALEGVLKADAATIAKEPADEEDAQLWTMMEWMESQGLPAGDRYFELADAMTGEALALFDLAWPSGIQEGLTQPVALLLNETTEVEEAANAAGFRYFTSTDAFKGYVSTTIVGDAVAAD